MTTSITEDIDATLAHYGIPGMKWGHRKRRGPTVEVPTGPQPVTIRQNKKGNLETHGGRGHNPSEDAIKAVSLRQKAHASGTHSLSNQELQTLVTRMNLESNYQKALAAGIPAKQKNLLEKFLEQEKNTLLNGKKTKTQNIVELIIKTQKSHAAKRATAATAATVPVLAKQIGR
jgi:hypothetical protein